MDIVQVEICTICNFECFYCAGRHIPQKVMDMSTFKNVLAIAKQYSKKPRLVNMQGEGEPTLHPLFTEFIKEVKKLKWKPYIITNGFDIDVKFIHKHFDSIGISLDTLNEDVANAHGRLNVKDVVLNIEKLIGLYKDHSNIKIYTTDYGQDFTDVEDFVKRNNIRHSVQPLNENEAFSKHYSDRIVKKDNHNHRCHYINGKFSGYMFFTIDGKLLPCPFIDRHDNMIDYNNVLRMFTINIVPDCCKSCCKKY